jgi:hypothetical protein
VWSWSGCCASHQGVLEHEAELVLEDAFTTSELRDDFRARPRGGTTGWSDDPWSSSVIEAPGQRDLLVDLLEGLDRLPERRSPRPYWIQRQGRRLHPAPLPEDERYARLRASWATTVHRLQSEGYLAKVAPPECVDDDNSLDPAVALERELTRLLGVPGLWPLDVAHVDDDTLYSLVEAVGDLMARPRQRHWHDFNGCGWHFAAFSATTGQLLYRSAVNDLLAQAGAGLRLADEGEDTGRLARVADDERDELVYRVVATPDARDQAATQHAVAMFRSRAASREEKRSAVLALARVLEDRRQLIEERLGKKDEGALFRIANEFDLRHRGVSGRGREQHADYDDAFLDWVFWWYLATVELTDRLLARQRGSP